MRRYILRRLLASIPVLVLVSIFTFVGQQMIPGDPVRDLFADSDTALTEEVIAARRRQLGLDRPLPVQYLSFVWGVVRGDFGRSLRTREPVRDMLAQRWHVTVKLNAITLALNVSFGIALGLIAALKPGFVDFLATTWALVGVATPNFWVGILLVVIFSVGLGWFPTSGWVDPFEDPIRAIHYLTLPVLALGVFGSASVMRQTRSSVLEVLRQDYVTTARSKGLKPRRVISGHVLKNAMLPVLTVVGLSVSSLFAGSVLVERIFAIPGLGRMAIDATLSRDYPVLQAVVLLATFAVVSATLLTDILYGYLDPRIRYT